jgi:hypothetical protein
MGAAWARHGMCELAFMGFSAPAIETLGQCSNVMSEEMEPHNLPPHLLVSNVSRRCQLDPYGDQVDAACSPSSFLHTKPAAGLRNPNVITTLEILRTLTATLYWLEALKWSYKGLLLQSFY